MSLKKKYDVVIAGAGPAGSVAAERAARLGMSVLLCEKRRTAGAPVRCAELSGYEHEIANFIPLDNKFICGRIGYCQVNAPGGKVYRQSLPQQPLMLHRDAFDFALFHQAVERGALGLTGAEIEGAEHGRDGRVSAVRVRLHGQTQRIGCDFLIGADGVESMVGRIAGIPTACPSSEIYSCLQYRMEGAFEPGVISFFVGNTIAPDGYIWIFPKREGLANVGIALIRKRKNNFARPQALLDAFICRRFPQARIVEKIAGGIPIDGGLKTFVRANTALIGDAAHHANPFSGGGIMNSMEDADLLIRTLFSQIREGKAHQLSDYQKIYYQKYGRILKWQRVARNIFYSFEDEKLDKLFATVKKNLKAEQFDGATFERAVKRAFLRLMPTLITRIGHLFG
jgi:digeranylgeranylglycerophospholipid reductase